MINRRAFATYATVVLGGCATRKIAEKMPAASFKKENKGKRALRQISFEEAGRDESKRQDYLNQEHIRMGGPAVSRIFYAESPGFVDYAILDNVASLTKGELSDAAAALKNMKNERGIFMLFPVDDLGCGKAGTIYVSSLAFEYDEKTFFARLEAKGRTVFYRKNGFVIGNRKIGMKDLGHYNKELLYNVIGFSEEADIIRRLDAKNARTLDIIAQGLLFMQGWNLIANAAILAPLGKNDLELIMKCRDEIYLPTLKILKCHEKIKIESREI